nr:MAG TPA: tail protein [Caudoviricetes sp.]
MINILDVKLSDLLPSSFDTVEIKALNNVVTFSLYLLQKYIDNANFTVNIDNVSEKIIDYLACEYRTPYYDEALDLKTKRNLVKSTMLTYQKIGTTNIIKEYLNTLNEETDVAEWYDYDGQPYNFKIFLNISENREVDEKLLTDIKNKIEKIKNVRSSLEAIEILNSSNYDKKLSCSIAAGVQIETNIGTAIINDDFSGTTFIALDDCILVDDEGNIFIEEE